MEKFRKYILNNKYFTWLQLFSNWLMQGIFHADKTEKAYKILFTVFFWVIFFLIFLYIINTSIITSLIFAFIIAHTLNWFVNNNLYVLLVHRMRWLKTTKFELFNQLEDIQNRLELINNKDWIQFCVSHGGICKGTLNKHSDIDVSIIRKPGLKNMFYAVIFYIKEKKYADLKGVPLDIFICDTPKNCIDRSKGQKNPIVLLDHNNVLDHFYPDKLKISINEAKVLNGEMPSTNL
ncbi:MAG: hypothetical protein L3J08_01170 [Flavobacteriaceae bacterium]|nr:hypothetical protein [Flavobacteriaceae bacterium]